MEPEQIQEKDLLWIPDLGSRNGNQYIATPLCSSEMKSVERWIDAHYGENLIWEQQKNISLLFASQLPLSQNEVPSSRRIRVYLYVYRWLHCFCMPFPLNITPFSLSAAIKPVLSYFSPTTQGCTKRGHILHVFLSLYVRLVVPHRIAVSGPIEKLQGDKCDNSYEEWIRKASDCFLFKLLPKSYQYNPKHVRCSV
jgi:hypothetical protein